MKRTKRRDSVKTIYLVGISHTIQRGAPKLLSEVREAFKFFLENAARHYSIRLIAEEMSREGLQGAAETICLSVATKLAIGHCYCDPDSAERAALGIVDVNQNLIAVDLWQKMPAGASKSAIERAAAADPRVRRSHEPREREWIRRLKVRSLFPALFVCGALHVRFFPALAKRYRLSVVVLEEEWDGK